ADRVRAILGAGPEVISVDGAAHSAANYERVMGCDGYRRALENIDLLLRERVVEVGLPRTWVVPRITRCDAVYEEIEPFYDKWLMLAGAAVIDPMPRERDGERIQPLGKPRSTARRDWRSRMVVRASGEVLAGEINGPGSEPIGSVAQTPMSEIWRRLQERRAEFERRGEFDHPDLRTSP
ncbi:MAG: hypothetical protein VYC34_02650, partial [Planctomycetota bacterium]|nr:hypothetical protein [Planctomycetota bacterium]